VHLGDRKYGSADVPRDTAHTGTQYTGVGDGRRGSNADNRLEATMQQEATSGSQAGVTPSQVTQSHVKASHVNKASHVKARLSLKFDHIASDSDGGGGGCGPAGQRSAAAGAPSCASPSPVPLGTFRGSVLVSRATGDVPAPGHEGARWKGVDRHEHGGERSGVWVGGLHAVSGQRERERKIENGNCASPRQQVMMV
jgi:hypothetical protein